MVTATLILNSPLPYTQNLSLFRGLIACSVVQNNVFQMIKIENVDCITPINLYLLECWGSLVSLARNKANVSSYGTQPSTAIVACSRNNVLLAMIVVVED